MTVCGFCFRQPENVLDLDLMYTLLKAYTATRPLQVSLP